MLQIGRSSAIKTGLNQSNLVAAVAIDQDIHLYINRQSISMMLPGPAFHFNKKVPLRPAANSAEDLHARLAQVEAQIAKKQGKTDRRSASLQALLKERAEVQARIEAQKKDSKYSGEILAANVVE